MAIPLHEEPKSNLADPSFEVPDEFFFLSPLAHLGFVGNDVVGMAMKLGTGFDDIQWEVLQAFLPSAQEARQWARVQLGRMLKIYLASGLSHTLLMQMSHTTS